MFYVFIKLRGSDLFEAFQVGIKMSLAEKTSDFLLARISRERKS
tara:strand:+ start:97 stop:228 length:132 start_codon:yes stop_codon:yes gene_type:complete